jgi:hypothetical protein
MKKEKYITPAPHISEYIFLLIVLVLYIERRFAAYFQWSDWLMNLIFRKILLSVELLQYVLLKKLNELTIINFHMLLKIQKTSILLYWMIYFRRFCLFEITSCKNHLLTDANSLKIQNEWEKAKMFWKLSTRIFRQSWKCIS